MSSDPVAEAARRRTFAIISHPDAGKTTLTEKVLLYGGALGREVGERCGPRREPLLPRELHAGRLDEPHDLRERHHPEDPFEARGAAQRRVEGAGLPRELHRRAGHSGPAAFHTRRALASAPTHAEKALLERRLEGIDAGA